jgi:methyl-accepting chemotaxis protein
MLSRIRSAASREAGLAGIALVIVIAWALAAVMMLTGTLIAAQQIDDRVATILGEVSPIDDDLDSVKLAQETDRIAKDILTAAEPLSGQLDQVIEAAGSIDQSVTTILESAEEINATAKDINGSVKGIGSDVSEIGSSVGTIDSNLRAVLQEVRTIEPGVAAINVKAAQAIALVRGITNDLDRVLALIKGHGRPGNSNLHGHANSIDCSAALSGRSEHCGE